MKGIAVRFAALAMFALAGCEGAPLPSGSVPAVEPKEAHVPTWYGDVEAIVQTKCQTCHSPGGVAPFTLMDYAETLRMAPSVAASVAARHMPPWPPSEVGLPLHGSRALTAEELRTMVAWANNGAPEGDPAGHVERHALAGSIRPDLVLPMSASYTPPNAPDDYRCFVIDPRLAKDAFVTGYEIRPGNRAIAHHAVLYQVPDVGSAHRMLKVLDDADPGPGFPCVGGPALPGVQGDAVSVIGSWKPGEDAVPLPAGTGVKVTSGALFVLEMHYAPRSALAASDRTTVALELAAGGVQSAVPILMVDKKFSIPAGEKAHPVELMEVVGNAVPAGSLFSLFPHMHQLGHSVRITLERHGQTLTLIDIPHWDFDWQGSYVLETPVRLEKGDRVRLRCVFDNGPDHQPLVNGAHAAPHEVHWGNGAGDEMCQSYLYVVPDAPLAH